MLHYWGLIDGGPQPFEWIYGYMPFQMERGKGEASLGYGRKRTLTRFPSLESGIHRADLRICMEIERSLAMLANEEFTSAYRKQENEAEN